MTIFGALLVGAAASLASDLGDYLRQGLQPPAPSTSPLAPPYDPPFEGGQCENVAYKIVIGYDVYRYGGFLYNTSGQEYFGDGTVLSTGTPYQVGNNIRSDLKWSGSEQTIGLVSGDGVSVQGYSANVVRVDGGNDNCGNLPNPNEPPPIPSDGAADSPPFDPTNDPNLAAGSPLVPYNPIGGALAGLAGLLAAAAAAAADAAVGAALKAIGDMLEKIGDALDGDGEKEEDDDKKDEDKRDIRRHDYGSIRYDGFLRLYPNGEIEGYRPEYIDLQMLDIPPAYGRFFGQKSPNFFRYKQLGYIGFVSPSFGVIEVHEIEFSRTSLNCPPNAYGFFYHLGLDGAIKANAALFYSVLTENVTQ